MYNQNLISLLFDFSTNIQRILHFLNMVTFGNTVEVMEFVEKFNFVGFEVSYRDLKEEPSGKQMSKLVTSTRPDGSAVMERVTFTNKPTATRCDVVGVRKRRPSHLREPFGPPRRAARSKINKEIFEKRFVLKTVPQGWMLYTIDYTPVPQWALEEYLQSTKFTTNPGFRIMDKMGWVPNTPLGIRGDGITTPIMPTENDRQPGEYFGLGYEDVCDPDPTNEFIKIICVGDHYGVALWRNVKVFVPKGALKHLKNILWYPIDHVGVCVMADMVMEEGKRYKWRVTKIRDVVHTMF